MQNDIYNVWDYKHNKIITKTEPYLEGGGYWGYWQREKGTKMMEDEVLK